MRRSAYLPILLTTLGLLMFVAATLFCARLYVRHLGRVAATPKVDSVPGPKLTYATYAELFKTTSSRMRVRGTIEQAFRDGTLLSAGRWSNPFKEGEALLIVTPTRSGAMEPVGCGTSHPYCALVLESPTTSTLLLVGQDLLGFGGVRSFADMDHALLWSANTIQDYMVVQQDMLNIRSGERVMRIKIERDHGEAQDDLVALKDGKEIDVHVAHERVNGKNIPRAIVVLQKKKQIPIPATLLTQLKKRVAEKAEALTPIELDESSLLLAESDVFPLTLFGVPCTLSIETGELQPLLSN